MTKQIGSTPIGSTRKSRRRLSRRLQTPDIQLVNGFIPPDDSCQATTIGPEKKGSTPSLNKMLQYSNW